MLRRYPLTILLVIATLVVDLVLTTTRVVEPGSRRPLLAGLLFGQSAVLALWAAWGGGHRLGRVSVMVITVGLVSLATGGSALMGRFHWLAILGGYTVAVYLVALAFRVVGGYRSRKDAQTEEPVWQVSLIELFGWTILVAIVSFAARSMDFSFVRPGTQLFEKTVAVLVLPMTLAAWIRKGLDDLANARWAWVPFAGLMLLAMLLLKWRDPRGAELLMLSQGGYLFLWYFVAGLDRRLAVRGDSEKATENAASDDAPLNGSHQLNA